MLASVEKRSSFGKKMLAGNPRRRPLIFSAIGDLAFFAARNKLKNNFLTAVQTGPAVILGGRKDKPVSSQNFVCTMLGENLIAAIRIHFQGRGFAMARLSRDLHAHAVIGSGKGGLRPGRGAAENQAHGPEDENSGCVINHSVMISHSVPQVRESSGPEGLRRAIRSAFTKKQCKLCAIKVTNQHAPSKGDSA